jgi:hypothetical protein
LGNRLLRNLLLGDHKVRQNSVGLNYQRERQYP